MDYPAGPRGPDKRNAAYESIFGRSSTVHHRPPPPPSNYTPSIRGAPSIRSVYTTQSDYDPRYAQPQPYLQPQQHYQQPMYSHAPPPPPLHAQPFRQSHMPPPQPVGPRMPNQQYYNPRMTIMEEPAPAPPPGMTAAQAYQAQVTGQLQRNAPGPSSRPDFRLEALGESFGDGKLDIDFPTQGPSAPSAPTIIEEEPEPSPEDSELPWAATPARPASDASSTLVDHQPPTSTPSSRPHPLQLNTALDPAVSRVEREYTPSPSASVSTHTNSSSSLEHLRSQSRRSSESARTMPVRSETLRRERTLRDKQQLTPTKSAPPSARPPDSTGKSHHKTRSRQPLVYPALLSRIAAALQARVTIATLAKDGLEYTDAFTGRDAVDKIAYIIKTTDRNLALLLGRALDAQKFFHDVTYDHRLRDSSNELYQFSSRVAPWGSGDLAAAAADDEVAGGAADGEQQEEDEARLPVGVFTLLTDCYSPTCSRDRLCYSISCPRRIEQQRRLHVKPDADDLTAGAQKKQEEDAANELAKQDAAENEDTRIGASEPGALWIHSVPQEVIDSVSDQEKKRQEAINEVIYTERDFVRDMEYLRDAWMRPLEKMEGIPEGFVEKVFWNIEEIIAVNTRLRDALNKRQKAYAVVETIGDILAEHAPNFDPFVKYGAHQLYGKYEFEREKAANPAFAAFVEETERLPVSRKLELNGYLTKPTTRLARYPLLLGVVQKYTADDNPDKENLTKVIAVVKGFLDRVNVESGKTENSFNLMQLDQQLVFRPGEAVDLRLRDPGRELIYKGPMKRRGGSNADSGDLQVFLFDHALLMVKQKSKHEQLKVIRRPIPLELLVVSCPDDPRAPPKAESKGGFPITFAHLGRKGYTLILSAATFVARRKWLEHIHKQQEVLRTRSLIFDTIVLSDRFFVGDQKRVLCAVPFDGGNRVVYGAQDGVYLANLRDQSMPPVQVLMINEVVQVDVLEAQQMLIVLSERTVWAYALDALRLDDIRTNGALQRRVSSHINFFKAGTCLGRTLVCVVKTSALSSTIKALEPVDKAVRGRSKPTFRKWVQGTNDALKPYKEFYIPLESSSLHFLKSRICIGCTKGFEIVDLETLDTQGLLDPQDSTLDFVKRREGLVRPMAIYRVDTDFLLCYDEFAFYVNKNGWRARPKFIIFWEGMPTAFALHYPYVLAFEPSFVEVRHVETGQLMQVIQGSNLRCLFAENPPSTTNTASPQYSQQHYPSRTPYGMSAPNAYGGRQSMYSQYSMSTTFGFTHGQDRDEIIMVSEDRIMALRLANATEAPVGLQPAWNASSSTLYSQQSMPPPPPPQHSMPYQHPQAAYSQSLYGH
ncbi:CNH-domain-containing protein [Exidia glandulosa HHB12029]|uniref:CNH-domain-containing protein n=1 Tax=Exidia glandulosa HHB12029 TaxID=1314781 RepID=A0A165NTB6_EXIGL|nr:CNH-domain-containing protein [Exidia glandulosa HHB12029]